MSATLTPKMLSSTLLPCFRLLAVGTASLLALRRTEETAPKFYFASEAVVTAALESMQIGQWPGFVPLYLVLRPLNFTTALWAVPPTLPAALTAVFLAWVTYLLAATNFSLYAATAIVQGGLYVLAGASAAKRYPALAVTWLMLGIFNLGFADGWRLPFWASLNQWWLAAVVTAGFTTFALTDRSCRRAA